MEHALLTDAKILPTLNFTNVFIFSPTELFPKGKNSELKLIIYIKKKVKTFCFQKEEKNPKIKLIIKYAPIKTIIANESSNKTLLSATR